MMDRGAAMIGAVNGFSPTMQEKANLLQDGNERNQ
jgi:hypothetical protein